MSYKSVKLAKDDTWNERHHEKIMVKGIPVGIMIYNRGFKTAEEAIQSYDNNKNRLRPEPFDSFEEAAEALGQSITFKTDHWRTRFLPDGTIRYAYRFEDPNSPPDKHRLILSREYNNPYDAYLSAERQAKTPLPKYSYENPNFIHFEKLKSLEAAKDFYARAEAGEPITLEQWQLMCQVRDPFSDSNKTLASKLTQSGTYKIWAYENDDNKAFTPENVKYLYVGMTHNQYRRKQQQFSNLNLPPEILVDVIKGYNQVYFSIDLKSRYNKQKLKEEERAITQQFASQGFKMLNKEYLLTAQTYNEHRPQDIVDLAKKNILAENRVPLKGLRAGWSSNSQQGVFQALSELNKPMYYAIFTFKAGSEHTKDNIEMVYVGETHNPARRFNNHLIACVGGNPNLIADLYDTRNKHDADLIVIDPEKHPGLNEQMLYGFVAYKVGFEKLYNSKNLRYLDTEPFVHGEKYNALEDELLNRKMLFPDEISFEERLSLLFAGELPADAIDYEEFMPEVTHIKFKEGEKQSEYLLYTQHLPDNNKEISITFHDLNHEHPDVKVSVHNKCSLYLDLLLPEMIKQIESNQGSAFQEIKLSLDHDLMMNDEGQFKKEFYDIYKPVYSEEPEYEITPESEEIKQEIEKIKQEDAKLKPQMSFNFESLTQEQYENLTKTFYKIAEPLDIRKYMNNNGISFSEDNYRSDEISHHFELTLEQNEQLDALIDAGYFKDLDEFYDYCDHNELSFEEGVALRQIEFGDDQMDL